MEKSDLWQKLIKYILTNKGKVIGSIIGFIFGILFLIIGFFKTLLVFLCTLIGYFIGSRIDIDGNLKKLLDKILPPIFK